MRKAALYLRRSTDRQPQSVEDQRRACQGYAAANGFEIVKEYTDDAKSGTNARGRKQFLQMIADAQSAARSFTHILVYDVSRFGRVDNDEAGYWRYQLHLAGVEVVYVKEGFNGDDAEDLLRPVRQWQAHDESIKRSMLTIRGQVSRAKAGGWNGGVPQYGYDLEYLDPAGVPYMRVRFVANGNGGWNKEIYGKDGKLDRVLPERERIPVPKSDHPRLVPGCPHKVAVVERIFRMCVREDKGFRRISEAFNSEGIPAPKGGKWSTLAVRAILKSPIYTGNMVWNRRSFAKIHCVAGGQERRLPKGDIKKQRHNDSADWIGKEGTHAAIIDRATFDLAQRKLAERALKHTAAVFRAGRAKNSPYLLTGLIHCKRCGHNFQGYTCSPGKDSVPVKTTYYVCNGYVNSGKSVCPRASFRREGLESGVLALVGRRVDALLSNGGKEKLRRLIASECRVERPDIGEEIKAVRHELQELDKEKTRLTASVTPNNKWALDEEFGRLAKRGREIEARRDELETMNNKEVDSDALAEQILATVSGFGDLFEEGTLEEKKEFIRLFVERIDLDPGMRVGQVYMRRFPVPTVGAGEPLLVLASKARYTHQKTNFPPVDVIDIQFEPRGRSLVPVGV